MTVCKVYIVVLCNLNVSFCSKTPVWEARSHRKGILRAACLLVREVPALKLQVGARERRRLGKMVSVIKYIWTILT